MIETKLRWIALIGLTALSIGCTSGSSSTPTTPSQTFVTDVLTGILPPPVGGVLQQSIPGTFVVGQGGGSISVTLTSAIETFPITGPQQVAVGVTIGTPGPANNPCSPLVAVQVATQSSAPIAALTGTINAGTYCVLISDVTNQLGPVSYAVAVTHP
jgi:hypothetical protein